MQDVGKLLVVVGGIVLVVGVLLWTGVGRGWLGRLPGDFSVSGERFSFHFPIVTCLVLSVIASLALWLLRRF